MNRLKTIGILGGMGPMAAYDLGMKILTNTEASCDQENIPVILDNNTRIADRTAAILSGGEDPAAEMIKSARRLEQAGADLILMACNTAHYFYDEVSSSVRIPVLHMIRETVKVLENAGIRRAGVLATDGTRRSGIYDSAFRRAEIEAIYPSEEKQKLVMSLVYDYVKAARTDMSGIDVDSIVQELKSRGCGAIVLGCTELPLVPELARAPGILSIDPTEVLARAAIVAAGGTLIRKR